MAKHTITHTCGHASEAQLYGKMDDRPREAARLAARLCTTCYRAKQLSDAQQQTASLPALVGSEKQIAWATTIRAKLLGEVEAIRADFDQRFATAAAAGQISDADQSLAAQTQARGQQVVTTLTRQTAASYWIDRRSESGRSLFQATQRSLAVAS